MNQHGNSGEFTGRHMLLIMIAFFGVIIAVNLTMASFANSSWTGLIVKNSYVASQQFNEKAQAAREQAALGWSGTIAYEGGTFRYTLVDAKADAIEMLRSQAFFRRPVDDRHDSTVTLEPSAPGELAAAIDLKDGIWIVEVEAEAGLEHPYRDVRRIALKNGVLQ